LVAGLVVVFFEAFSFEVSSEVLFVLAYFEVYLVAMVLLRFLADCSGFVDTNCLTVGLVLLGNF